MRKIVVSQFLTLDGILESPEKWNTTYLQDAELVKDSLENFDDSDALLLGHTTYQFFEARWPSRTGALADRFNGIPKYVVSNSLQKTSWDNSTIMSGNAGESIKQLKKQAGKNILVLGSHQLIQTLLKEHLIDEYKLYVYPLTLGTGKRLFEQGAEGQTLTLLDAKCFASGVVTQTYSVKL